jgi:hypothetical protein
MVLLIVGIGNVQDGRPWDFIVKDCSFRLLLGCLRIVANPSKDVWRD